VLEGPIPESNHVAIIQSAGTFTVRFVGTPGATYLLQRSVDLANWETVLTQAAAADGYIEFSEPAAVSGSVFYRMVAQ
jgi:hypothetical protein